jgi:toxin secretion/phage lysis holin
MKVEKIEQLIAMAWASQIIKVVIVAVVMDTVFGCIRAAKERRFNSCFGIDGAIRKISMLVSIAFLLILDRIVGLNLIGFIPEAVRTYLPVKHIGAAEFFALLYIAYETVSILKNMTLCGLPVKRLWQFIRDKLRQYTSELPDNQDEVAPK